VVDWYAEHANADFRDDVARAVGATPERVVPGHATPALIGAVAAAFVRPGDTVFVPEVTDGLHARVSAAHGAAVQQVALRGLELDLADGR
jgi:histidinol-phosphate/aromatic aminotransferase/cobyric acid decarboxylase-like protein